MWFDSWSILFYDFFLPVFFPVSKSVRWLFLMISRHFLQMKINFDISFFYSFLIHTYVSQIFFWYFWGEDMLKKTETESTNPDFFQKKLFWSAQNGFLFGNQNIYIQKRQTNLQKKSGLEVWSDFVFDLMISWWKF